MGVGIATVLICVLILNMFRGPSSLRELVLLDKPLRVEQNEVTIPHSLAIADVTRPDAKVVVTWAGAAGYYADRDMIDLLGKCDAVIARGPMDQIHTRGRFIWFWPGHMKWDYAYSLGELQPDVIQDLWKNRDEAALYMDDYIAISLSAHRATYVRRNSPMILWEKLSNYDAVPSGVDLFVAQ